MSADPVRRTLKGRFAKKTYYTKINNLNVGNGEKQDNQDFVEEENNNWKEGRRIVELDYLAEQLRQCKNCSSPLSLHNCQKERRYGLGSILYIQCDHCPLLNQVSTGKRHRDERTKGMQIWDVNTKLSMAYIDAGMGPHQTVNFLAALNIPPITVKSLKQREREIGKTIENCTDESCQKALQEEIALTTSCTGGAGIDSSIKKVAVAFDGAWQKRGSGRSYSSLTEPQICMTSCLIFTVSHEGRSYIPQVYNAHNLSPGKFTQKHTMTLDKKRKKKKELSCLPQTKRKRLEKKQNRSATIKTKEVREGTTYSTAVSHGDISEEQLINIPEPIPELKATPVQIKNQVNVFFDFETTGFGYDCDVIQIAATYGINETFNKYIVPEKKITPSASKVTGFTKCGHVLFKKGEIMMTDSKADSMHAFVHWLPENCILLAHNCKSFDSKILFKLLEETRLFSDFNNKCVGFVDTLTLMKEIMPERKVEKKSFSQEKLVQDIVGISYDAHDAMGDVKALQTLFNSISAPTHLIERHSFDSIFIGSVLEHSSKTKSRTETFSTAVGSAISGSIINKMAGSGLEYAHLKLAYERGSHDGIQQLLGESLENGKPRVTKNKKIINSIVSHFENSA